MQARTSDEKVPDGLTEIQDYSSYRFYDFSSRNAQNFSLNGQNGSAAVTTYIPFGILALRGIVKCISLYLNGTFRMN
jgi:hypothetical protein